jgi:hypothetical protein
MATSPTAQSALRLRAKVLGWLIPHFFDRLNGKDKSPLL